MNEYYLPIPGFENFEASNYGNIRRKDTGKLVHMTLNEPGGYPRVRLDGVKQYVHRIIAMTFFDVDITTKRIRHIDGDRWNNHIGNLELINRDEDIRQHFNDRVKRVKVVTCRFCKHCNNCDIRPLYDYENWFCADGVLKDE